MISRNQYQLASKSLRFAIIVFGLLYSYLLNSYPHLPQKKDIHPFVLNDPEQFETEEDDYTFDYYKNKYLIEPVAEYTLSGVVVSHNNIHAFGDIYHDESSVDIKDICVIWGKNTELLPFESFTFYSEPWSCHVETKSTHEWSKFNLDNLSNTHLLSASPIIRKELEKVSIGDQVHLRGMLINYCHALSPSSKRKSSTIRTDTGNGACEVMMVTDFQMLKKNPHSRDSLRQVSRFFLVLSFIAYVSLFIWDTYLRGK